MKTLVSWSSGKDSAWMLHVLKQDPSIEIGGLLTTMNEQFDRVAMHAVRRRLLEAQASAAGVPLRTVQLPWPCTNEQYEDRMRVAVSQAVAEGFTHVAFGDLFLEDVRKYREEKLAGTGLTPIFPYLGHSDRSARRADGRGRLAIGADVRQPEASRSIVCGPPVRSRAARRPSAWRRSNAASAASFTRSRGTARCSTIRRHRGWRGRRSRWVRLCRRILSASSV